MNVHLQHVTWENNLYQIQTYVGVFSRKCLQQDHLKFYHKTPKYSDTRNIAVIILICEQCGSTIEWVLSPKDADGMANSVEK